MRKIETESISWGRVSAELLARDPVATSLAAALSPFSDEPVLRVSVPYGTILIEDGIFRWDLLDGVDSSEFGRGKVPIPLGLVTAKAMELYAPVPGQVHRNLPIYLVLEGEFFGLFEAFAPSSVQSKLGGAAGASTLLVIALIGNGNMLRKFGKPLNWTVSEDLHRGIKRNEGSSLAFGQFFSALLDKVGSEWRMEFVLFPRVFIEKISENCSAQRALLQFTINQLAVAHSRAETTLDMLDTHNQAGDADALAARQIAHGFRPGFVPVLGTVDDERLLPAEHLHRLLYDATTGLLAGWCDDEHDKGAPRYDFFPAIFRPSLAWEDSYYFFQRAYGPAIDRPVDWRIENFNYAIKGRAKDETELYEALTFETFGKLIASQCQSSTDQVVRKVRIGHSPFVDGGIIYIKRKNGGAR